MLTCKPQPDRLINIFKCAVNVEIVFISYEESLDLRELRNVIFFVSKKSESDVSQVLQIYSNRGWDIYLYK